MLSGNVETPKIEAAEKISGTTVKYSNKKIPVLYNVDICVCGGGPGGTAAAISAARNGAKVVLIERGIALGGLATLGCVYPFMDTHAPNSDTPYVAEVKQRLLDKGIDYDDKVTKQVWHNPEVLSLIYDEMCEESGVNIMYNTVLVDALTSGNKITTCII
ncbi:MAG: FAD-dependent oxidoreductase [Selenomonadaceae bacterium]|nr:FAD-dependent oxidoreductase [Selenomonadaceae bacterium]